MSAIKKELSNGLDGWNSLPLKIKEEKEDEEEDNAEPKDGVDKARVAIDKDVESDVRDADRRAKLEDEVDRDLKDDVRNGKVVMEKEMKIAIKDERTAMLEEVDVDVRGNVKGVTVFVIENGMKDSLMDGAGKGAVDAEGVKKAKFECDYCGKQFRYRCRLTQHLYTHTEKEDVDEGLQRGRFECEYCHKRFMYRSKLTQHIAVHTKEKNLQCAECGKRYSRIHTLNIHQLTHLRARRKI